jgi:hypothetical protein
MERGLKTTPESNTKSISNNPFSLRKKPALSEVEGVVEGRMRG